MNKWKSYRYNYVSVLQFQFTTTPDGQLELQHDHDMTSRIAGVLMSSGRMAAQD